MNTIKTKEETKYIFSMLLKCSKCYTSIYKEGGCNKITCSCGNIMCWICKKDINHIGYRYFCNKCSSTIGKDCTNCHTWDIIKTSDIINKIDIKNQF